MIRVSSSTSTGDPSGGGDDPCGRKRCARASRPHQRHAHRRTPTRRLACCPRGSGPLELVRPADRADRLPVAHARLRTCVRPRVADGTAADCRFCKTEAWTCPRRGASGAADDRLGASVRRLDSLNRYPHRGQVAPARVSAERCISWASQIGASTRQRCASQRLRCATVRRASDQAMKALRSRGEVGEAPRRRARMCATCVRSSGLVDRSRLGHQLSGGHRMACTGHRGESPDRA